MRSIVGILGLASLLAAGCAHAPRATEYVGTPAPSKEMAKLERLVGAWTGTAEFVSGGPTPAVAGSGIEKVPVSMKGESVASWIFGGAMLKSAGWHETPDGKKEHFVEYVAWDSKAGTYRAWWFSDSGQRGEGTMTIEGNTLRSTFEGVGPDGTVSKGNGASTFMGENLVRWTWTEMGPEGEVRLEGTMTRKR